MGRLRSFFSSLKSKAMEMGSSLVEKAKNLANKAIDFMAEKAEGFIGEVNQMWQRVKPLISTIRIVVQTFGKIMPFPWLKGALRLLDKALALLESIDKSALAKKVKDAIEWVINWAKEQQKKRMDEEAMAEARRHAETLAAAQQHLQGEARGAVDAMALLNHYLVVKASVERAVEQDDLQDFEYYLRLRAVQKLLAYYDSAMLNIEQTEDINEDMYFIVEAAQALIEQHASFSDAQTIKLDEMTQRLFGKPIIPFIFEEMIIAWEINRKGIEEEWALLNKHLAKDNMLFRCLQRAKADEELEPEEVVQLNDLSLSLPRDTQRLEALRQDSLEKRFYVNAAEGFLQMLEKDEATLLAEGRDYLLEQGAIVGQLLIDCAQNGRSWGSLSDQEQGLIVDFANIFEQDCQARTQQAQLVEVAA